MADDDYGAAQPIMDVVKGAYKKANHIYGMLTGGNIGEDATTPAGQQKQVDPNYQSDMLKRANDSFKQQIPTQTKAQKRPAVSAKIQVKTSVKPGPQKQAGGK